MGSRRGEMEPNLGQSGPWSFGVCWSSGDEHGFHLGGTLLFFMTQVGVGTKMNPRRAGCQASLWVAHHDRQEWRQSRLSAC